MKTEAQIERMLQFSKQFYTIFDKIFQPEKKVKSEPVIKSKGFYFISYFLHASTLLVCLTFIFFTHLFIYYRLPRANSSLVAKNLKHKYT